MHGFFPELRKPIGLFWLERRREIVEAFGYFKKWHAMPEGKAAIYGSLTFAAVTLVAFTVSHILMPTDLILPGVDFQFQHANVVVPCKLDGRRYLYGFKIVVKIGDDRVRGMICRNIGERWDLTYDQSPRSDDTEYRRHDN